MSKSICTTSYRQRFILSQDPIDNEWKCSRDWFINPQPESINIRYYGELLDVLPKNPNDNSYYLVHPGLLFRGEDSINPPDKFYFFDISTKQIYQVTISPPKITRVKMSLSN